MDRAQQISGAADSGDQLRGVKRRASGVEHMKAVASEVSLSCLSGQDATSAASGLSDREVRRKGRGHFKQNESGLVPCLVPSCPTEMNPNDLHRNLKVPLCRTHQKVASFMDQSGQAKRFCQQCQRAHTLDRFDGDKRGCRKRLEQHNKRRRKKLGPASESTAGAVMGQDESLAVATEERGLSPAISSQPLKKDAVNAAIKTGKGAPAACNPSTTTAEAHNLLTPTSGTKAFLEPSGFPVSRNAAGLPRQSISAVDSHGSDSVHMPGMVLGLQSQALSFTASRDFMDFGRYDIPPSSRFDAFSGLSNPHHGGRNFYGKAPFSSHIGPATPSYFPQGFSDQYTGDQHMYQHQYRSHSAGNSPGGYCFADRQYSAFLAGLPRPPQFCLE